MKAKIIDKPTTMAKETSICSKDSCCMKSCVFNSITMFNEQS